LHDFKQIKLVEGIQWELRLNLFQSKSNTFYIFKTRNLKTDVIVHDVEIIDSISHYI